MNKIYIISALVLLSCSNTEIKKTDNTNIEQRLKAGKPATMVELRIVDEKMEDVPQDGKSVGEIVVRAPWLNVAYLKDLAATESIF